MPRESFETSFVRREEVARQTAAFHFAKPDGFDYAAGQFITLILPQLAEEADEKGNRRAFTLSSAPLEDTLAVTTRLRDTAFKQALAGLSEGEAVGMKGPFGKLTLPADTARPVVFLAGGIGITPFRSMLREAAHDGSPHSIWLFYANHSPEDAAFLDEMQSFERTRLDFHFVPTVTRPSGSAGRWEGETGRIDRPMLERYLSSLGAPLYCVAGPPAMVVAMRNLLQEAGVNSKSMHIESFGGY